MKTTGNYGEQLAAGYLRDNGYDIVTTNWHCQHGEIDIVARKEDMLVFVEVKTRRTTSTQAAFASITPKKRERLIASAYAYLDEYTENDSDSAWRIDAIGVALSRPPVIDHVEDALDW
jgi:putative endonuclease